MSGERRYRDDEVREIFGLATSQNVAEPAPRVADAGGLTLTELQGIGGEVGLSAEAVARAAAAYDSQRVESPRRKQLGMPVEVGHTTPLQRALSEAEWERLVAELRRTFRARGRVSGQGTLREWHNGNLFACVEPAAGGGYQLRMGTRKGDAMTVNVIGAVAIGTGWFMLAGMAAAGELAQGFYMPVIMGSTGVGVLLSNIVRLPRWARQREQQMAHVAEFARLMSTERPGE